MVDSLKDALDLVAGMMCGKNLTPEFHRAEKNSLPDMKMIPKCPKTGKMIDDLEGTIQGVEKLTEGMMTGDVGHMMEGAGKMMGGIKMGEKLMKEMPIMNPAGAIKTMEHMAEELI